MWPGAGFLYSVAVLLIAACYWIAYHTSEGILQKELVGTQRGDAPFSQRGDVLVALRDAPPVRRALLSGCHSIDVLPAPASTLLASGLLAYVQSGTKIHVGPGDYDDDFTYLTIAEGRLKGREVLACKAQVYLPNRIVWP